MSTIIISLKFLEKRSVFIFSAILFKVILEYTYINFVHPIYSYSGFYLDVSFVKYLEGWFVYLLFLLYTPHLLRQTSDFVINTLFFSFLSPLLVFYSLSNARREHLYFVLLGVLIIYLLRKGRKIKIPIVNQGHIYAYFISILGIVTVTSWLIFSGGLNFFNLDLTKVYEFRRDVGSVINIGIISYLNIWAFKVFGPFLLIIFLHKKNYGFASLVFLLHILWFGISSHKSVLFFPFVILFIYLWFRNSKGLSIMPISLNLVIFFSYLSFAFFDDNLLGGLIIRRVFFVPSFLTFTYYEFFSSQGFIYWSNSITSSFIHYPYDLNPAKLIGSYLATDAHANNSFLSTGYMHAGIPGIIFYSLIFVIILRLVDSLNYNSKYIWTSVAIIIIPMRSLIISSDLTTAILTHGILISLILLALSRYKFA
jgi:hypothetical protein